MFNPHSRIVIVADGNFPVNSIPLSYIRNAKKIICCDGSTETLACSGFIPDAIVGDMDSLPRELETKFADRIYKDSDQETNDLTKAVNWCLAEGFDNLVIVGATGKREDHTIGNISLLAEYMLRTNVIMVTDTGFFIPLKESSVIPSFEGQQVSVFSIDINTEITSVGLKYPLSRTKIHNWWQATLNESLGRSFRLDFNSGRLIVYLKFR
ncbi:MAG TPA: thiamine diphosphokinase [Bacteroidales bacterium]|nr:thiamine diphosphokinase [Bacteroidales bacterium]